MLIYIYYIHVNWNCTFQVGTCSGLFMFSQGIRPLIFRGSCPNLGTEHVTGAHHAKWECDSRRKTWCVNSGISSVILTETRLQLIGTYKLWKTHVQMCYLHVETYSPFIWNLQVQLCFVDSTPTPMFWSLKRCRLVFCSSFLLFKSKIKIVMPRVTQDVAPYLAKWVWNRLAFRVDISKVRWVYKPTNIFFLG